MQKIYCSLNVKTTNKKRITQAIVGGKNISECIDLLNIILCKNFVLM